MKFITYPIDFHDSETQQRPKTPEIVDLGKLLPQQETPVPKTKMKTINWNKIPSNKLMGKNNIWTMVADSHQNSPMAEMDWSEMEGLFCQQATSTQNSPKMGARDSSSYSTETSNGSERKARKENSEVIFDTNFHFTEEIRFNVSCPGNFYAFLSTQIQYRSLSWMGNEVLISTSF